MGVSVNNNQEQWIPTTCSQCFNACPVQVKVKDGKVIDIKGDPTVEGAAGKICGKGKARITDLYNPRRVTKPLKRTNPEKGIGVDPRWVEISWEEAMDIIVARLKKIRREDPRKLIMSNFDIWNFAVPESFGQAFGTQNCEFFPTTCGNGLHTVFMNTLAAINSEIDVDYCNYMMLWGSQFGHGSNNNPLEGMRGMAAARNRGAKLVVVDPICGQAAAKADEWIPILPGTDGALALGMINHLVNKLDLYDVDYMKQLTNGPYLIGGDGHYVRDKASGKPLVWDALAGKAKEYDAEGIGDYALEGRYQVGDVSCRPAFEIFKEHIKQNYSLSRVEQITTVPAPTIARIAKEFGEAARIGSTINIEGQSFPFRPAALEFKRGSTHHKNSYINVYSMMMLNIIVGNLNVPGGLLGTNPNGPLGFWNVFSGKDGLVSTNLVEKLSGGHSSFLTFRQSYPPREVTPPESTNMKELMPITACIPGIDVLSLDDLEKVKMPYKPEMMMICRSNFVKTYQNPKKLAEILTGKLDFLVGFAIRIDETMELMDIILPDAHDLERHWLFPTNLPAGFQKPGLGDWYFQCTQPVVDPPAGVKSWLETLIELADRLDMLPEFNALLNKKTALFMAGPLALDPNTRYSVPEITGRIQHMYAAMTQQQITEDLFTAKNPVLRGGKKAPHECYAGAFTKARIPIYLEHMLDVKKEVEKVTRAIGMNWWDVSNYHPLMEWRPCPAHEEDGKEFDLFLSSSKLALHTHSLSADNPWVDDICTHSRLDYNLLLNTDTARRKGIKDGDTLGVESRYGKVKGKVRVTGCVHPQVLGVLGGPLGGWARQKTIGFGKGIDVNSLLPFSWDIVDTISGQLDSCARVKVYKEDAR